MFLKVSKMKEEKRTTSKSLEIVEPIGMRVLISKDKDKNEGGDSTAGQYRDTYDNGTCGGDIGGD